MSSMTEDLGYLAKLFILCKEHGVSSLKLEGLEFTFRGVGEGPDGEKMKALSQALASGEMTDEQMLFFSAPQAMSQEQIEGYLKQMGQGG